MTTTKKLIVTETIHYEFELPPDHPEDHDSLKALFAKQDPWSEADFAAITETTSMSRPGNPYLPS